MKIERIVLGPKDILLIRPPSPLSHAEAQIFGAGMNSTVLDGRVLVLPTDFNISVIAAQPE